MIRSAPIFVQRMRPYGEARSSHRPRAVSVRAYPEMATPRNAMSATVEYRRSTLSSSCGELIGRTTTSRMRPPSHIAAEMTCRTRDMTAGSWLASSPEWPWVAMGIRLMTASTVVNSTAP